MMIVDMASKTVDHVVDNQCIASPSSLCGNVYFHLGMVVDGGFIYSFVQEGVNMGNRSSPIIAKFDSSLTMVAHYHPR